MSQKFPDIRSTDYIDTGILDLQHRDDAVLTMFSGEQEPENPFQDLLWNDLSNKCIKWYNNDAWETIINYGTNYISEAALRNNFQELNGTLTTYSSVESGSLGFINNTWVPISSFFINKLSQEIPNNIGLKKLAYKSKLTSNDIEDNSLSVGKVSGGIETNPPYKVGDCIVSFNIGVKEGCVRLSTKSSVIYTIGSTGSNPTYSGNAYRDLYKFIWENLTNLQIYTSSGVTTIRGSSWEVDWNNNNKLELPHIDLPTENTPSNYTLVNSTVDGTRANEKLDIFTQFDSQKTKKGSVSIPKNGYYRLILVGGGGGSSDRGNHSDGNGTGGAGAYFNGILLLKTGQANYEIGYGGRGCYGYARNNSAFDGSYSRFSMNNVYVNCPGGYGGRCSRDGHVEEGIKKRTRAGYPQGYSFAPTYNVSTGYLSITGKSSNGLRQASWYNPYGKGADTVGGKSSGKVGNNGFISLVYIGPEEYGTVDTSVINSLNNLYKSLSYFMKY